MHEPGFEGFSPKQTPRIFHAGDGSSARAEGEGEGEGEA